MTKSKNFLHNIIKTFSSSSNRGKESQDEDLGNLAAQDQKVFAYQTLVSATNKFHIDNKLGQGGFGPVFKGKLVDGVEVAVKKLSQTSNQGKKEFVNEAKLLARVQHRNVVSLLGYCVSPEKLLVYEYVPNESLDKLLFSKSFKFDQNFLEIYLQNDWNLVAVESTTRDVLDWKRRYDIIAGVARGLLYLHEDAHDCIIHRDIKASNILLDENWVPKIADFGMAKLYPEDQTHVNTRVAGTNGYMAPEYVTRGNLSVKADVYSFGVVVLELISGQKNFTFNLDPDCINLLDWAYKMYKKGKGLEILEPILASSADPDQVATCIKVGLLCTQFNHHLRPTMSRVVVMLSRKSSTLNEPTQPGYLGSRHRRSGEPSTFSSSGGSNSSTTTTTNTATTTRTPISSARTSLNSDRRHRHRDSTSRGSVSDPYGKRPIRE